MKKRANRLFILRWIIYIVVVCALAFACVWYWGRVTTVIDDGMEPTILNGEFAVIDRIIYNANTPKRGDIIAFKENEKSEFYSVSRVVGLPGETVQIVEGSVLIDGEVLKESYVADVVEDAGEAQEEIKLGENEYFVLGDNPVASMDSRMAEIGVIHTKEIEGKIWASFSTLADIKFDF